jgi:hypothetical protein
MEFEGQKIAESNFAAKVMGAMSGAESGSAKLEKVSSLEAFIRKIFAEETKKKPRLSWGSDIPNEAKVSAGWIGKFNRFLTYIGPIGGFYIQNRMVLKSNGQEAEFEEIPDTPHRWTDRHGQVHVAPSDRETAKAAFARHIQAALAEDPLLCSVCAKHRAKDADERMAHLYNQHPAEFAAKVGLPVVTAIEQTTVGNVEKIEPEPVLYRCEEHNKSFKSSAALAGHKRFLHKG